MGTLLDELTARRAELLACLARHRAANPRVFGSVARGEDGPDSDIDLLVEFDPEAGLFDAIALQEELQALFVRPVEVTSERGLHPLIRERVIMEARPL
ncbi:nucleotidyltransferase [Pseudothauera nasutitermitis]|uniref:Nucleotidyltransferase n=1 Tax=Pseudothauera nasutitermitis TaxID=2565930 RepID=A0A4S4AXD6_9RHOO|nr:nucleotidyltransferase family protein [Pseudothauera nasutitermitis]THF64753.1 nucleotidyltransferase [Pseudothauera nasutitermitis]